MTAFVDTSALYVSLDASDARHADATRVWERLLRDDVDLVTTSYVLVETTALVQRRLGMPAVSALVGDVLPVIRVVWVDATDHAIATGALLGAARRDLSLVDCVSFQVMRRLGLADAFTFDRHFEEQGFRLLAAAT